MKKSLFLSVFLLLGICSLFITVYALINRKWDTTTAALSLLIANVSAWVAYETFRRQDEARRPQLTLSIDSDSRYSLIQLVCRNSGEMPAYNIEIIWNNAMINHEGKPTRFNYSGIGPEIVVLNSKEEAYTWVTSDIKFYDSKSNFDMSYSGLITFQESLNSKKRFSQAFAFSLQHNRRKLSAIKEEMQTMRELQKLPDRLEGISKELRMIRDNISSKE
jgi:hypothetical protein